MQTRSNRDRVAILMDGAYVIKRLQQARHRFPASASVRELAQQIGSELRSRRLYRIFFYHADPYSESQRHPLTRERIEFGNTATARNNDRLLRDLEEMEDFAVRRGDLAFHGWQVRRAVGRALAGKSSEGVRPEDFVPNFTQKGVDMRIGLDIAALVLKRMADTAVLVNGDADVVAAGPARFLPCRSGERRSRRTPGAHRLPSGLAPDDGADRLTYEPGSVAAARRARRRTLARSATWSISGANTFMSRMASIIPSG